MNAERWREVERLFHQAVARPVSERPRFLEEACRGDDSLRSEVESLLTQTASGEGLNPPLSGRRLGVYQVQERIGAGGMGEVYRARDTRLGRDVAIKVLFFNDATRLARFEREAKVLAALNHPLVAQIYGFE